MGEQVFSDRRRIMNNVKRLLPFATALVLVAICVCVLDLYLLKRRADTLVEAVYRLSLSQKPPTVGELRHRFGSALTQPNPCIAEGCGYDVFLSNRTLAALHLLPYAAV